MPSIPALSSKLFTNSAMLLAFTALACLGGYVNAQTAVGSKDLFRCRQSCYQKFVQDWHHCMDFEDCKNMCITPPNINSYIPEAFSFLCWNNCDQQLGPFPLNINSALRQGSLVLTDIAWDQAITNQSKQCLVTWEVSGGGLMGNLLTDSSTVELSLWPDTVYHVQVTCKHKETGGMRRSYKLIVDTHKLSDSTATGMQAIALDTTSQLKPNGMPNIYAPAIEQASSAETDSRMRILKDSSKDFLTPYNPNAETSSKATKKVYDSTTGASTTTTTTVHVNSVLRNKLIGSSLPEAAARPANTVSVQFLTQSIVFAVVGSVIIFLGLLMLYVLTRPVDHKHIPSGASAIDKEVLIRTEMLPSQTPAALQAVREAAMTTTAKATAVSVAVSSHDARTLHV